MKKLFSIFIILSISLILFAQKGKEVLFGEIASIHTKTENTFRVFYDKKGDLYPNFEIKDEDLEKAEGVLKTYFENNKMAFLKATKLYDLEFDDFSDVNYSNFQKAILNHNTLTINKLIQNIDNLNVLIHGFRKEFNSRGQESSSRGDNQQFQNAILQFDKKKSSHFYIEIYWNGTYTPRSRKLKKMKAMLRLFEDYAIDNAIQSGYRLRSLISKIEHPNISVISHSLGAQVTVNCFFNSNKNKINQSLQDLPTPSQNINLCFVAPAISGKLFDDYFHRYSNLDFKTKDNYKLFIIYNEKDVVLKKRWKGIGPGPRKFGRTTLGCNHRREVFKLEKKFKKDYPNSTIQISDATKYGLCHAAGCYAWYRNFEEMVNFITNSQSNN